jgi:hypothetical protein
MERIIPQNEENCQTFSEKIDVEALKSSITVLDLVHADGLKPKKTGANWTCCCPIHSENTPSFTIYPGDGGFYCFGCGAGGSVIDYVMRTRRVDIKGALDYLANRSGTMPAMARQAVHQTVEPPAYVPIPVPHDAPPPPTTHYQLGKPTASYAYHDATGRVVSYAVRFQMRDAQGTVVTDTETGKPKKTDRPLTWGVGWNGSLGWQWKGWPPPKPLFNLHLLSKHPGWPVVVCEGEKAATAAMQLPGMVATCSMNGAQSPGLTDWTPLRGRTVFIWPDNDEPGKLYAEAVVKLALEAGAASVAVWEFAL